MKEKYGGNAPVGFMLYDSFESEESLKKWNLTQFNILREQAMSKKNGDNLLIQHQIPLAKEQIALNFTNTCLNRNITIFNTSIIN